MDSVTTGSIGPGAGVEERTRGGGRIKEGWALRNGPFAVYPLAVLFLMGASAAEGGKTRCTDIPIRITIVAVDGGVLSADPKGSYKTGADGLSSAGINICGAPGSGPTYDATMWLGGSQRTMGITFPPAIGGSIINGPSPKWANGQTFWTQPTVWVRNILWGRMNGRLTFTTRFILKGITGPGDASAYDLRLQPDVVDALDNPPPYPDINNPAQTATVTVQDVPGTCRGGGDTLDSWIVTADSPFIGTLYKQDRRHTHSGQYTAPLKLLVEALSCVPF